MQKQSATKIFNEFRRSPDGFLQYYKLREEVHAEIEAFKKEMFLLMQVPGNFYQGKPGDAGYTPRRGLDYFTSDDIAHIIVAVQNRIRVPKDGVGIAGHTPTTKELTALIKPLIPEQIKVSDGYTPKPGIDYPTKKEIADMIVNEVQGFFISQDKKEITKEEISEMVGKLQERVDFKARADEIARALETLQGVARLDYDALKNKPGIPAYNTKGKMNHGGGDTLRQGTGITLTYNSDGTVTVATSASGITIVTPAGTVDASNVTFIVASQPQFVISDGIAYVEGQGYSYSLGTITMDVAPSNYIRAVL